MFIQDVRKCENPSDEIDIIGKEVKKIRQKFLTVKKMSGYDRKKYVWKLLFAYLNGFEVNFGYKEVMTLVESTKYSEKYTGYVASSILIPEYETDIFAQLIKTVKNDLFSSNEGIQSLALNLIGSTANAELATQLVNQVLKLALGDNNSLSLNTRKKSLLCLLRIYRKYKESFPNTRSWIQPLNAMIEKFANSHSVVSSIFTVIEGVLSVEYSKNWDGLAVNVAKYLNSLVVSENCPQEYQYYKVPHPWLQIKGLRILSLLTVRNEPEFLNLLKRILQKILDRTVVTNIKNKDNTEYSILFEAVKVIIRYKSYLDLNLQNQVLNYVVIFLTVSEPNVKYLTLETMTSVLVLPNSGSVMKENFPTILSLLDDIDTSIRRRVLDLLYLMCTANNVGEIVEELLKYSEKTDMSIKEELALKIAILAERFADNLKWYIDVIIRLMTQSGDYISDDIWWRVCQLTTGFKTEDDGSGVEGTAGLKNYAIESIFSAVANKNPHENLIKLAAYVLPEFQSCDEKTFPVTKCFKLLEKEYNLVSGETKGLILNAYAKLAIRIQAKQSPTNAETECFNMICSFFQLLLESLDDELQKRAFEYLNMIELGDPELSSFVLSPMPPFPESCRENNPLVSKMIKQLSTSTNNKTDANTVHAKNIFGIKEHIDQAEKENQEIQTRQEGYENMMIEDITIKFPDNPLLERSRARVAWKGKGILLNPNNIELPKLCLQEFRNLLLANLSGVLYQDNHLVVEYKSDFTKATGRAAFQFSSKSFPIKIVKVDVASQGGLIIQTSPPTETATPQFKINITNNDNVYALPTLNVHYKLGGQDKMLLLTLPIFIHRFLTPYQIDDRKYMEIYNRFTNDDNFFKIDDFVKNPAPSTVSMNDVMKKIGSLMSNLNIKVIPYPSMQNIKALLGTAQLERQNQSTPSVPVIVEVEGFEDAPEFLRLSIRSSANPSIVASLYKIITVFLSG